MIVVGLVFLTYEINVNQRLKASEKIKFFNLILEI